MDCGSSLTRGLQSTALQQMTGPGMCGWRWRRYNPSMLKQASTEKQRTQLHLQTAHMPDGNLKPKKHEYERWCGCAPITVLALLVEWGSAQCTIEQKNSSQDYRTFGERFCARHAFEPIDLSFKWWKPCIDLSSFQDAIATPAYTCPQSGRYSLMKVQRFWPKWVSAKIDKQVERVRHTCNEAPDELENVSECAEFKLRTCGLQANSKIIC
jgi:hypothetical protein